MTVTAPPETRGQIVRRVETGLLATTVTQAGRSTTWMHTVGAQAPRRFAAVPVRPTAPGASGSVVVGAGDDVTRTYTVTADQQIADVLFGTGPTASLDAVGRGWGAALRELHFGYEHAEGHAARVPAPRTLQRAQEWLSGSWAPARDVIGDAGLDLIRRWTRQVRRCAGSTVVHGQPGMAHWVVGDGGRIGVLLTGEDVGSADPVYDLAWVKGEIAELYTFYPAKRQELHELWSGFRTGYGVLPDVPGAGVAFRLAQHAFDWHHYAGASLDEARMLLELAGSYVRTRPETSEEA